MAEPAGFARVPSTATGAALALPGWRDASVRILRPFSWDAKHRGLSIENLVLDRPRTLVSGPYATADAAALNHDPTAAFEFPADDGSDMTWYRAVGTPATAEDLFQDSAGWCTIAATTDTGMVAAAFALREGSTVHITIAADSSGVDVEARHASGDGAPELICRVGSGEHDDAEEWLRALLRETMPQQDRLGAPPFVADTWGFGTDIGPGRVAEFFDAAAGLGLEVVTIDKGWEAQVGDWVAQPSYRGGVTAIARAAHDRGLRLGLWVAPGNAAPESELARDHPDWLATWHGQRLLLSHRTHVVCLGHEPAAASVLDQIDALATAGMDWLLHDFETIARCDARNHTHEPDAGERAAAAGWYGILEQLRLRHPQLIIENCWNGGRQLDLEMVAHHDTTIGDDWCRSATNLTAKLGLGRYLPAGWCTAYMGDEDLPVRSWLGPYLVGGPWVLMGDLPGWDPSHRDSVRSALEIARRWRTADRMARVVHPETSEPITGLSTSARADGSRLAIFVVTEADVGREVRWFSGPGILCDEWTGQRRAVTASEEEHGVPLDTSVPTGLALSVHPS